MNNHELFELSRHVMPGGVNSPVRSFMSVNSTPFITQKAHGCYLVDIENKTYIDYICSWGANIVGHANDYVINHVYNQLKLGSSYGTTTELEYILATKIIQILPYIDMLRLVNSGTEATMSAIRVARGFTHKKYLIKFDGCYHGHFDGLLASAGSGVATYTSSSGVLDEYVNHTIVLPYNDIDALYKTFETHGTDIACIIVEPIAGNMNMVRPTVDFLNTMRALCTKHDSVLIFDEVMSGLRVSLGGATQIYGITPDLVVLGKVIGGGLPLAMFGGKGEIMKCLSPIGSVYQAGTLSGNPLAVSAGIATLDLITSDTKFYENLHKKCKYLIDGVLAKAKKHNIAMCGDYEGGMFGLHFCDTLPQNFTQAKQSNKEQFNRVFHELLKRGVYIAPSVFEAGFMNMAHDYNVIDSTIEIFDNVFDCLNHE